MRVYVVILAAGKGERFGADKLLEDLNGKPVWRWSYDFFSSQPEVVGVGLVCSRANVESIHEDAREAAFVVLGGSNRQESSLFGVKACPDDVDAVLIHDGARPFVDRTLFERVLAGVSGVGAAAPGVPVADTIRQRDTGQIVERERLVAMQTPQGAKRKWLLDAHQKARELYTDEMALLRMAGYPVEIVEGEPGNFKITTQYDLQRARGQSVRETRTGLGYDVHRFSSDPARPLLLGGVRFPEGPGLEGHSDADVLLHAAVDALLGAASLGDIGQHFPPSDSRWKNEPSLTFLRHASGLVSAIGWSVVNLDIAVIAEKPRIMHRSMEMRQSIAGALGVGVERVSVKATTNEGLGSIGRGEGIAAFATATIAR